MSAFWNDFLKRGYTTITNENFWNKLPDGFWNDVPNNFWSTVPSNFWSTVPKDFHLCKQDGDVVGKTTGTQLQLDAVGPQDSFLDAQRSYFVPSIEQHTNFVTYQREYKLLAPFFGQETKFTLNPRTMGHILTNAWIKCTLPALPTPNNATTTREVCQHSADGSYTCELEYLTGFEVANVTIHNDHGSGYGVSDVIINWDQEAYGDNNTFNIYINSVSGESNVSWTTGTGQNNYILSTQTDATSRIYDGEVLSSIHQNDGGTTSNVYITATYNINQPKYADQVGRALLKEVKLRVGNYTIQTLIDDWYIIRDQLFTTEEQKDGLKYLINGGQDYGQLPASDIGSGPIPLFIPLELFFCHRNNYTLESKQRRPYLPLCALIEQDIELSIQFNDIRYFTYLVSAFEASGENFFTLYPDFDLTNVSLVLEMADLDPLERQFFAQGKYDIVAPTIYKQPKEIFEVGDPVAINLIPNGAIKSTFWFLRSVLFEDDTNDEYYDQRFNFSSKITTNVDTQDEFNVLTNATLYLQGYQQQNFGISHLYYKYIQPMTTSINPPDLNVYTMSYALKTLSSQPSGFLDLSIVDAGKAVLKLETAFKAGSTTRLQQNNYVANTIHFGEMVLRINDGQLTPLFSLT